MKAREFYSGLLDSLRDRKDVVIEKHKIKYLKGEYDFLRIASEEIGSKDRIILIRAGIHGDEIAGPLTILKHANQIIDRVHRNRLKIILYPLGNPSGFELGQRYNIDNDKGSGKVGNNDFLRYELEDGGITDDIGESDEFKKWYWTSDKKLEIRLPKETKLMHNLLGKDPLSQIVACLDLHQDFLAPDAPAAAYHYSFGDQGVYQNIIGEIQKLLPVQGFRVKHDGSLDDLMHRLGVKYSITCETTGATPLDIACKVNLIWTSGLIDLLRR